MLVHNLGPSDSAMNIEDEASIDTHFKTLVELSRTLPDSSKDTNIFDLALEVARIILTRRLLFSIEMRGKYQDPYILLMDNYPRDHKNFSIIGLAHLNSCLTMRSGANIRDETILYLDKCALDIGTLLVHQFTSIHSSSDGKSDSTTLFDCSKRESKQAKPLEESRTQFARAVSFYHSLQLEAGNFQTIAWCDLLIEIIMLSQRHSTRVISKEECNEIVSGIMAIKAIALSSDANYGAGLKTAREAWKTCASEVGNIVTLFYCSVRYELSSDSSDEQKECINKYSNTLLELDNAILTFLTLSKILPSKELPENELLRAFPIMCNTCMENDTENRRPLLLGLQQRWIDLYIKSTSVAAALNQDNDDCCIKNEPPGGHALFSILRVYLCNFEYLLPKALAQKVTKWQAEHCRLMHNTLDLLLKIRGCIGPPKKENNKSDILDVSPDTSSMGETFGIGNETGTYGKEINVNRYGNKQDFTLIWDNSSTKLFVGRYEDCLWIGKNIHI